MGENQLTASSEDEQLRERLLPCPFCGSTIISFGTCMREDPPWWFVHCADCLASTNDSIADNGLTEEENKALAVESWNRRAKC